MSGAVGGMGGASEAATSATGPVGPHHQSQCCAINFRVRCEDARHGESVFLYQNDFTTGNAKIPLYTTPKSYPWYTTRSPVTVPLSTSRTSISYRHEGDPSSLHSVPLSLLQAGELYTVNDCLGNFT